MTTSIHPAVMYRAKKLAQQNRISMVIIQSKKDKNPPQIVATLGQYNQSKHKEDIEILTQIDYN